MAQRLGSLGLAFGLAGVSAFGALAGAFWGFSMKCGDSCSSAPEWRDNPEAWQWEALGWVAIGGFACALVFLALVAVRLRAAALAALVLWGVLGVAYTDLFRDSGLVSHDEQGWLAISGLFVSGLIAIVLTPSRKQNISQG
jgi:hypothetical protein